MRAVLLDVGGTLWSERSTVDAQMLQAARHERLRAAGVPADRMAALDAAIAQRIHGADALDYLDIWAIVRDGCEDAGVSGIAPEAVRHSNSLPATTFTTLLPGARLLLEAVKGLGLRCVIVSNGIWRSETDYWDDFRDFELADNVQGIVSSVDTLWRKPNHRIYEAALKAAETTPNQCLLVGNSETKDIQPAMALGMTTIRVAIEEERPSATQASYLCDSLPEVADLIHGIRKDGT